MIVNLHIDRLVLDGLPVGPHQGPLVEAALVAELGRLLSEASGTAPTSVPTVQQIRSDPITIGAGGIDQIGVAIARAIYGGIDRSAMGLPISQGNRAS